MRYDTKNYNFQITIEVIDKNEEMIQVRHFTNILVKAKNIFIDAIAEYRERSTFDVNIALINNTTGEILEQYYCYNH